jgi:hypothetical protein
MANSLKQVTNAVNVNVGKVSLWDALLIAGFKSFEEPFIAKIPKVGNGNFMSASVKSVGAVIVSNVGKNSKLSPITNIASASLLLDGAEDMINAVMNRLFNSSSQEVEQLSV